MKKVLSAVLLSVLTTLSFAAPRVESGVISYNSTIYYKNSLKRTLSNDEESTLAYLNTLRQKVGLGDFTDNNLLNDAAYNHAYYMKANNYVGHYEDSSNDYYTGYYPWNRTVYAGYLDTMVSENLSYGQDTYMLSIEGLFSAIYHRFGFLDTNVNEIGIGIVDKFYVYDMGNTEIEAFCENPTSASSGYTSVCKDSSVIVPKDIVDKISSQNPKYILWPYPYESDTTPVFYEESPDPLPDYSVSGYPVSINFNPYFYENSSIALDSFKIYKVINDSEEELSDTRILDKDSDPNGEIDRYKFALFPLNRLEWNTLYKVVADFTIDGENKEFSWEFKTKPLEYPWYEIGSGSYTYDIKNSTTYALYMPPQSSNDVIGNISYSYSSTLSINTLDYYDQNTLLINVSGNVGDHITLSFANRSVTLNISQSDTANPPMEESDINDSTTQEISVNLKKGWNLVDGSFDINSTDISYMWKYEDGSWSFHSKDEDLMQTAQDKGYKIFEDVKEGEGVWIYSKDDISLSFTDNQQELVSAEGTNWQLLGVSKDVNADQVSCTQGSLVCVWGYENSDNLQGWRVYLPSGNDTIYPTLDTIKGKSGFWVKCE